MTARKGPKPETIAQANARFLAGINRGLGELSRRVEALEDSRSRANPTNLSTDVRRQVPYVLVNGVAYDETQILSLLADNTMLRKLFKPSAIEQFNASTVAGHAAGPNWR